MPGKRAHVHVIKISNLLQNKTKRANQIAKANGGIYFVFFLLRIAIIISRRPILGILSNVCCCVSFSSVFFTCALSPRRAMTDTSEFLFRWTGFASVYSRILFSSRLNVFAYGRLRIKYRMEWYFPEWIYLGAVAQWLELHRSVSERRFERRKNCSVNAHSCSFAELVRATARHNGAPATHRNMRMWINACTALVRYWTIVSDFFEELNAESKTRGRRVSERECTQHMTKYEDINISSTGKNSYSRPNTCSAENKNKEANINVIMHVILRA